MRHGYTTRVLHEYIRHCMCVMHCDVSVSVQSIHVPVVIWSFDIEKFLDFTNC